MCVCVFEIQIIMGDCEQTSPGHHHLWSMIFQRLQWWMFSKVNGNGKHPLSSLFEMIWSNDFIMVGSFVWLCIPGYQT